MADASEAQYHLHGIDAQQRQFLATLQAAQQLIAANLPTAVLEDALLSRVESTNALEHADHHGTAAARPVAQIGSIEGSLRTAVLGPNFSRSTADDSDSDDDDDLYVQEKLPSKDYDLEGMRSHMQSYEWNQYERILLDGVVGNPARLAETPLIPNRKGRLEDRSDYTHYQVFDVGPDGSPLSTEFPSVEKEFGRAMALWHAIKEINPPTKPRPAVGRITIFREPSPILFGAIHYTMSEVFDMSEIFSGMSGNPKLRTSMQRPFDEDERRQRSHFFSFKYFTIIGKECEPAKWQLATTSVDPEDDEHRVFQLSQCNSVVALHLGGNKIKEIRNPQRQSKHRRGVIYDPFSPWQVLNIEYCPDYKSTLDVHESSKHYVNGPEAFMTTLLGQFRDAKRRLGDVSERIAQRIRPPVECIFDSRIRHSMIYDDDRFTMTRRYFWASQTLEVINDNVKAMIDAFDESFDDQFWEGKSRTLWPIIDDGSRSKYYLKKMALLRKQFEDVILELKSLIDDNNKQRLNIHSLREDLYTGTAIQETRRSMIATETTVQQGRNIKLLTLASIFFLPLTFVTSIFGMTNMPTGHDYSDFAKVTIGVCIPFFAIIACITSKFVHRLWDSARIMISKIWMRKSSLSPHGKHHGSETSFGTLTWVQHGLKKTSSSQLHFQGIPMSSYKTIVREELSSGFSPLSSNRTKKLVKSTQGTSEPSTSRLAELWLDERKRKRNLGNHEIV